jgi:hypothetical protein
MTTPTIQDIADEKDVWLNEPAKKKFLYAHAFEELVETRSAEYRGEIPEGSTATLLQWHRDELERI